MARIFVVEDDASLGEDMVGPCSVLPFIVESMAFMSPGVPQKRAALCAERGSSPITMVGKERLNITDRKNGSWKRQGQAVRPVPVRVSPASRSWQIHGSVPLPAVPCPLSAVSRVRDQLGQPASGTNSGPTGRTVGTDSVRLCRLRCGQ